MDPLRYPAPNDRVNPQYIFPRKFRIAGGRKLRVSAALQTKDPRIFAAGDAVTIFTADGKKYTPWTWPQAVSQGKLAAANLYRSQPVPLKALTRVNSMNLQGLSLNMLGAFVEGSEEIFMPRRVVAFSVKSSSSRAGSPEGRWWEISPARGPCIT